MLPILRDDKDRDVHEKPSDELGEPGRAVGVDPVQVHVERAGGEVREQVAGAGEQAADEDREQDPGGDRGKRASEVL